MRILTKIISLSELTNLRNRRTSSLEKRVSASESSRKTTRSILKDLYDVGVFGRPAEQIAYDQLKISVLRAQKENTITVRLSVGYLLCGPVRWMVDRGPISYGATLWSGATGKTLFLVLRNLFLSDSVRCVLFSM